VSRPRGGAERLVALADPAMVLVTTVAGTERAGCLVGFHTQCSIDPFRYAIWLSKANHTFRVSLLARHWAVHFLDAADLDLAELFGGRTGDQVDKFAACAWQPHATGVPLLDRCPHRLVVRRVALLDEGSDHVCLVTEPIEVHGTGPAAPMRLSRVAHLSPGHEADARPRPPSERAP